MELGLIAVLALLLGAVVVLRTKGPKGNGTVGGGGYEDSGDATTDGTVAPPSSGPNQQ